MADEHTINIPQLLLLLFLGGLALRWFFFTGSSSRISSTTISTATLRTREADVERVQQMFPQFARRNVMWDLQRNGGNVAATTERILSGRGLEMPPQSFQPTIPNPPPSSSASPASSRLIVEKSSQPNLIARYNLAAKIGIDIQGVKDEETLSKAETKPAWSQNKNERQALLQRRREEMILDARRKMQSRVTAENHRGDGVQGRLGKTLE